MWFDIFICLYVTRQKVRNIFTTLGKYFAVHVGASLSKILKFWEI